ncbi:MAG: alpha/beta fold hydrolase [Actinobacteria bacterium]|nr:alpha/beta fold hydrolase [Actinomycetota bacterium]
MTFRRSAFALLCATALAVGILPTSPAQAVEATTDEIVWLPCGQIECGKISTPVRKGLATSGTVSISLYRRKATSGSSPRTLLLLPDREYGSDARTLTEKAVLTFGTVITQFNVISVAPRGAVDAVMPVGSETEIGTLDMVNDLEAVRSALHVKKVSVLGWGSGATTATALIMQNPSIVQTAVLDSPIDPSSSMVKQAQQHITATALGVETAMRWCASHLSCPMNANVAKELDLLKTNIRLARVDPAITYVAVARAAIRTIVAGNAQELFAAITTANNKDSQPLLALIGSAPTAVNAYGRCADVSRTDAKRIAKAHAAVKPHKFTIGSEAALYALCAEIVESARPLGSIKPAAPATSARVLVNIARGDQVTAPSVARTMAKKMNWTYTSVYANRHLVVGFDNATTVAAMTFLAQ